MKVEYDEAKNLVNIRECGQSFERVYDFDFTTAILLVDERRNYGEIRRIAVGYLGNRLHILCFMTNAEAFRVISFRKANLREATKYGKPLTID